MELKNYQRAVIRDLERYLEILMQTGSIETAYRRLWEEKHVPVGPGGMPRYQDLLPGVANVCLKVPTGGGKTFLAANAIEPIFHALGVMQQRVVVWLVPSDAILTQTLAALRNPAHPYRQKIDVAFNSRVEIYTKDQLLSATRFNISAITEQLSILVLSYDSFRGKKEQLKARQENSSLAQLAQALGTPTHPVEDADPTALLQIINQLRPVVIVDESHHARSTLSKQMLRDFNPRFVLDLTATPTKESNLISIVDAIHLRQENMVKLPVFVMNRNNQLDVLNNAVQMQSILEAQAMAEYRNGGCYIRPIVLFQAQPKGKEDAATFEKIRTILVKNGIPAKQIAIKTADINELKNADLLSPKCPIRFIITVNALKEGWDCPFAYILASLANRTSTVDVEQILGRILRQPYAMQHKSPLLNTSYVLTNSVDFHTTLEKIVAGLNKAGFSRKDYRIGEAIEAPQVPVQPEAEQTEIPFAPQATEADAFDDVNVQEVKTALESTAQGGAAISAMVREATVQAETYTAAANEADDGFMGGELGDMLIQNRVQPYLAEEVSALRIPQFFLRSVPDLFGDEFELLEKENLSEGFSLTGQDAQVSFELATGEMYRVDVEDHGEAVPKYKRADSELSEYIRNRMAQLPPEQKIQSCTNMLCTQINRNNRYAASEINDYVRRIVGGMTQDELAAMETAIPTYAAKISQKIEGLEEAYREEQFLRWLDAGKIVCRESYVLPPVITPAVITDAIPKSLYEAEKDDMNPEEHELIDAVVALDNVKWWHRIIEKKGFRLNGFINHYPDFMVMTKSGKLVLIEYKGDDRDNSNSARKLKLGRKWQAQCGQEYRYFMVFKNRDFGIDGAYTLDRFVEIMKEL